MRASRTRGLTLIELTVAAALLAALIALAYAFLVSTPAMYGDSMRRAALEETARRALEDMVQELRTADADRLSITPYRGSDRVEFRVPRKYSDRGTDWKPFAQYRCESSVVDANHNGFADEGRLVRVEGEDVRTLCHSVAPGGLSVSRRGDHLTIRLALAAADSRGRPLEAKAEASVTLRNRSGLQGAP